MDDFRPEKHHGFADSLVFDSDGNGPLPGPGEPDVPTPITVATQRNPVPDGWRLCIAIEPYLGAFTDLDGARQLRAALDKAIARMEEDPAND
jgi:hypothetical protein